MPIELLARVPKGEAKLGAKINSSELSPERVVAFNQDFYISKSPISVKDFHEFILETGYVTDAQKIGCSKVFKDQAWQIIEGLHYKNAWPNAAVPATCVSLNDAFAYCFYLNDKKVYSKLGKVQVPSEDQWEFAAKDLVDCQNLEEFAWVKTNSQNTLHLPQQKRSSQLGLFDVLGNIAEWTNTPLHSDIIDNDEKDFITKGGSFLASKEKSELFSRGKAKRNSHCFYAGFRIVVGHQPKCIV